MTLLGISVGATRTGVCILRGGTLLDRQVHMYQSAWSDDKVRVIGNRYLAYIRKYKVDAIVVKIPPLGKHTRAVSRIIRRIERIANRNGCEFDLITKVEMKHITGARSPLDIRNYVLSKFPELGNVQPAKTRSASFHQGKLYEAILAAYIFQERIKARNMQRGITE